MALVLSVAVESDILVFLASAPGFSVSRSIDFGDNSHSSRFGIGNDGLKVVLRVDSSNASGLTEFGDCRDIHGEGVLVGDVPMKDVELGVHHHVDGSLDGGDWEEVAGCIDHQSSPEV